jgi:exodeoxyribonuclease-3
MKYNGQVVSMHRLVLLLVTSCFLSLRAEPAPFRMVAHNVWYGFTKKGEPRHTEWLAWMKEQNPDVVSLQELNSYTPEKLAADARAWGHEHSVLLKEDGFPTGFTSRTPITGVVKLREGFHHGLMRVETRGLTFYVVHFHPSNFERRIDYIFLSPNLLAAAVSARILRDERTGRLSDHYPLLAELNLAP